MPTVWLCNICKLLVDRDFEHALLNIQLSKLNKGLAPNLEASRVSHVDKNDDKTGLMSLIDSAKETISMYDPVIDNQKRE